MTMQQSVAFKSDNPHTCDSSVSLRTVFKVVTYPAVENILVLRLRRTREWFPCWTIICTVQYIPTYRHFDKSQCCVWEWCTTTLDYCYRLHTLIYQQQPTGQNVKEQLNTIVYWPGLMFIVIGNHEANFTPFLFCPVINSLKMRAWYKAQ